MIMGTVHIVSLDTVDHVTGLITICTDHGIGSHVGIDSTISTGCTDNSHTVRSTLITIVIILTILVIFLGLTMLGVQSVVDTDTIAVRAKKRVRHRQVVHTFTLSVETSTSLRHRSWDSHQGL
jgi:hypothetical protein